MNTFSINVLIQLQCLRHVSTIQVFILRKTCTLSFMVLLIWMHESNTTKLHVKVFQRMNNWMFETCQRHCIYIKILM